ncbi:hypothetical protein ACWV27_25850 (plasmid) [Massilia varians]
MTIHRSQPVSASHSMPGDFVRLVSARGASYPQAAALGPAIVLLADGMFGKIDRQDGRTVLVPDARIPALLREIGPMTLSESVVIERVSVEHEHEKAIMGLQYLRQVSDVARQRATGADGTVQRGVMQAMLGDAAGSDLRRIADELQAAGIQVVEKKVVRTIEDNVVFLTRDPEAVRAGRIPQDTMQFESEPKVSNSVTIEVYDASRTRELLLATQPIREVQPQTGEQVPAAEPIPAAHANIMNLLGIDGMLTPQDVGLDPGITDELGDPDEDQDQPGMR